MRFDRRKVLHEALVLGLLIVGIMAARSTLADHYYVPSGSMEETLLAGDRVFVDKRAFGLRVPFTNLKITAGSLVSRGDVVIFDSPTTGVRLIKRIVAVGGDHVQILNGHLSINGVPLASESDDTIEIFGGKHVQLNLRDGGGPNIQGVVDEGMVLAVGDHRGSSADGRIFGTVAEKTIYGRALAVYFRSGEWFVWRSL